MGCVNSKEGTTTKDGASVHPVTKDSPAPSTTPDQSAQAQASSSSPAQPEDDPYIIDYVLKEWRNADRDNSGRLSLNEILKLLKNLNITLKHSVVKEKFKRFDKDNSGELDFSEFRAFLDDLRTRTELKEIFTQYSKGKPYMTEEDFVMFLQQEQYELGVDAKAAAAIIKQAEHSEGATKLYFTEFSDYIASQINSAYNSTHRNSIYQDMDQPLTHYYIDSSHNTYIFKGDQLTGESSVEAYSTALEKGCRCVELDCWDGDDGNPIIYHGHTVVSRIKFRDVVQTIKEHAFTTSPYPVVLSLENHCSLEQQVRMAEIMKEILGDSIPKPFIVEQTRPLPSPNQLKYKFLIKGKMLPSSPTEEKSSEEDEEVEEEEEDVEDAEADEDDGMTPQVRTPKAEKEKAKEEKAKEEKAKPQQKPVKVATAKELSDMVHFKSTHFGGFQKAKEKNAPWEVCSFSELKVKKILKTDYEGFAEYNMNITTRVYPKGTRFDSSNYNPIASWVSGCHMVALNFHTAATPMWLNMGKFLDNSNCGYLLKPLPLRSTKHKAGDESKITLHVNLIGGWQLPKESGTPKGEVIDPYVKIKMFGIPEDTKKYRSKVVQNNGFNPIWNEKVSFALTRSDLAQVIFEIYDKDTMSKDDFIGYSSIPVASIKPGYRSVHLHDAKSNSLGVASLLVQFAFEK